MFLIGSLDLRNQGTKEPRNQGLDIVKFIS